jgi:hypothetical protein
MVPNSKLVSYKYINHYRIRMFCREPDTPGKGYFALGKAFAGSCTRQRASGKNLAGKDFFAGSFLSGTRQRISLPKTRARSSRQNIAPGKSAFAGGQAPGKV